MTYSGADIKSKSVKFVGIFDTVLYLKKAADNGYYQSKGKNMIEVQMADEQFGFMQEKDTTFSSIYKYIQYLCVIFP